MSTLSELKESILADGQLDKTERALIDNLKKKSKTFPEILNL